MASPFGRRRGSPHPAAPNGLPRRTPSSSVPNGSMQPFDGPGASCALETRRGRRWERSLPDYRKPLPRGFGCGESTRCPAARSCPCRMGPQACQLFAPGPQGLHRPDAEPPRARCTLLAPDIPGSGRVSADLGSFQQYHAQVRGLTVTSSPGSPWRAASPFRASGPTTPKWRDRPTTWRSPRCAGPLRSDLFFIFSDYARPAIRFSSAGWSVRRFRSSTHDGDGDAEDGSTPSSLRAADLSLRAFPALGRAAAPGNANESRRGLSLHPEAAPSACRVSALLAVIRLPTVDPKYAVAGPVSPRAPYIMAMPRRAGARAAPPKSSSSPPAARSSLIVAGP